MRAVEELLHEMTVNLRYQGGGSSHVEPFKCDDLLEEMKKLAPVAGFTYAKGYNLESDEKENLLFVEALEQAKAADVAIVFAGLPERYESEGYDREHINIPPVQNMLISEITKENPNTVVVLANGAVVAMPWVDEVSGILESYLGGEAAGGCADPEKCIKKPAFCSSPG